MQIGVILGDVHGSVSPREHLDGLLRQVEAAQRNGLTYLTIGHHYIYGEYRWLQPIPVLARLAAELDDGVTLGTTVIQVPLYHPIDLAEEQLSFDKTNPGSPGASGDGRGWDRTSDLPRVKRALSR